MLTEFAGRIRFVRQAAYSLLALAALWLVVSLPLWLANRSLLDGVPKLSPVEMRLAMPQQSSWAFYGNAQQSESEMMHNTARLQAMGRGIVKLDAAGNVEWEALLPGTTRLAESAGGSWHIRTLSFSDDGTDCLVSAWATTGRQLWQISLPLPPDCIARVDGNGRMMLSGNNGNLVELDVYGRLKQELQVPDDPRYMLGLADGRRFSYRGSLQVYSPMLEPEWNFSPQEGWIVSAAGDERRIVAADGLGRYYCFSSLGELLWQDLLPATDDDPLGNTGGPPSFTITAADEATILQFGDGRWLVVNSHGRRLYSGRTGPVYNYQNAGSSLELFLEGPEGRRCFRSSGRIVCVDRKWRELWSVPALPGMEINRVSSERILLHDRGQSLSCLDWDGNQVWREELSEPERLQTLLASGGLTTFRTEDNQLVGKADDGTERFRIKLQLHAEYDLAEDGVHFYVRGTNHAGNQQHWLLSWLREALNISTRFHVDCHDADGRRIWRALLPEHMFVERLQRTEDGGLSVIATQMTSRFSLAGNYSEWEFIYRQPGNSGQ